jgi:hypothetical protein
MDIRWNFSHKECNCNSFQADESHGEITLVPLLNQISFRVKCTGGPSTCKKVSLRSINFENAFLGP